MHSRKHLSHALLDTSGIDFHESVVRGNELALGELFSYLQPRLRRQLRCAFGHVSYDLVEDAVEEAIVQYALHPTIFDASRGVSLNRFLYQLSWRNMADSVDAERRRRSREEKYSQAVPTL